MIKSSEEVRAMSSKDQQKYFMPHITNLIEYFQINKIPEDQALILMSMLLACICAQRKEKSEITLQLVINYIRVQTEIYLRGQ
ncbi:MAG: hypothetical protein ABSA17_09275 [Rhabdochlamydiaceae bacterium]